MFFENSHKKKEEETNKTLEIERELENLNRLSDELFQALNLKPEQLSKFLEEKENFTEENWKQICEQRQLHNTKRQIDLENLRNPAKVKKNRSSLNVQRHWLSVK